MSVELAQIDLARQLEEPTPENLIGAGSRRAQHGQGTLDMAIDHHEVRPVHALAPRVQAWRQVRVCQSGQDEIRDLGAHAPPAAERGFQPDRPVERISVYCQRVLIKPGKGWNAFGLGQQRQGERDLTEVAVAPERQGGLFHGTARPWPRGTVGLALSLLHVTARGKGRPVSGMWAGHACQASSQPRGVREAGGQTRAHVALDCHDVDVLARLEHGQADRQAEYRLGLAGREFGRCHGEWPHPGRITVERQAARAFYLAVVIVEVPAQDIA